MPKLKRPVTLETTFGTYTVDEVLGEGGAGVVYGGKGLDGEAVAVKVLRKEQSSQEKRKRFKNELAFLLKTKHPNISMAAWWLLPAMHLHDGVDGSRRSLSVATCVATRLI